MNLKNEIKKDINKIEEYLEKNSFDKNELETLHRYIDGKYQSKITQWGSSMYSWNTEHGFVYVLLDEDSLKANLFTMKCKLEGYVQTVATTPPTSPSNKTLNIYNTNSVSTSINITLNFDVIENDIKNMESLTEQETNEALNVLKELKNIYNSKDSRKTKWEKAKKFLLWLADKSVDVGIAYFPIIMEILK